jgi:class 3 adenylate cyclase
MNLPAPPSRSAPRAVAPPSRADWRRAYAAELDELFRQRLRVAASLFLILHVGAFVAIKEGSHTPFALGLRIGVVPLVGLLLASTWLPSLGRAGRAIAGSFIALIASYAAWNSVLAGTTLETRALMLTMLGAGLLFPFGTTMMLVLSTWVVGLFLVVASRAGDSAALTAGAFFIFGAGALATVAASLSSRLREREFLARRDLRIANEQTDALLRNMLPEAIADRLKGEEGFIADRHPEVTVMFADIAGFTSMSASLPPDTLVSFLNDFFSALDSLTTKHGLEKIKTIGDAYMVVGGLPEPRDDHADAIASMALDMQTELGGLTTPDGNPLVFRIGIHTGPVVAGVIGVKKLSYDLWGDTVNTASRMESHAEPGTIQVSDATRACLEGSYRFAARGEIAIKGKGAMKTFVLLGRSE